MKSLLELILAFALGSCGATNDAPQSAPAQDLAKEPVEETIEQAHGIDCILETTSESFGTRTVQAVMIAHGDRFSGTYSFAFEQTGSSSIRIHRGEQPFLIRDGETIILGTTRTTGDTHIEAELTVNNEKVSCQQS